MGLYGKAEGLGSQMGHPAKEIYRLFRIPTLQLSVGWTHATHGLDLAMDTLGLPGNLLLPQVKNEAVPSFPESSPAQVIGTAVGKCTDAARRYDRAP